MFGLQEGIDLEKALRQIQEENLDSKRLGELNSAPRFDVVEEEPEEVHYGIHELNMKMQNSDAKEQDESILTLKRDQSSPISEKIEFRDSMIDRIILGN